MRRKDGNGLLTLNDAAAIAKRDASTLRRQIHLKKLQATKFGRDWLVTREALDAYMKSPSYSDKKSQGRRPKD